MALLKYIPNPVVIPADCPLRREFISPDSTVDKQPLTTADYAEYDSKTMFYDVFYCVQSEKILAVGPPPVNLFAELSALQISHQGNNLPFTIKRYLNFCVVEIAADKIDNIGDGVPLEFCFPSFRRTVVVRRGIRPTLPPGIALFTLQKDNPAQWVADWCRWHWRLHGVSRVVVYDNGSDNLPALESALKSIAEEIDVVLVLWRFPYGPGRSDKNRYAQIGTKNHYRLLSAAADDWCVVLDVDEYLVVKGAATLQAYLGDCRRAGCVEVLFDSYIVPPPAGQPAAEARRVAQHTYRNTQPRRLALKYIFQPARIEYCRSHIAYPKNVWWLPLMRFPKLYNKLLRLFYGSLAKRLGGRGFSVRYASVGRMFYYHFRGLNTNWRPEVNLGDGVEGFDAARHSDDPLIRQLAEKAGLDG